MKRSGYVQKMHLDVEKHLFTYAGEILKDNVYFHPMFEERPSFLDMMNGQTDIVLGSSHPDIYAFKGDLQHSIFP
jgi:hypothetical protein